MYEKRFVRIATELPGPKSREVLERMKGCVSAAVSPFVPAVVARAHGVIVEDLDGNRFLDFSGGWGVLNVGHNHPKVVEAIKCQAEAFLHTDFTAVPYEVFVELAERISRLAPGPSPKKCAFFNSGAEAVENAVKISRAVTGRKAVLVFEYAFHGRTLLAMTMTHKAIPYKAGFGPYAPDIFRLPYPYPYRNPVPLEEIERRMLALVDPGEVACCVVEPVIGEGGFIVPPPEFLPFLRELADKYGFLLVCDEVQTGVGRTGKFFASEHFGVEPDLIAFAKSIAGGMPLSGVVGKAEVMDKPVPGSIGGTYVGNPLACAAALAVLDVVEGEDLLSRAERIGKLLVDGFQELQARYELIGDVRGLGAMVGMELVRDRTTKEPAAEETRRIAREAINRGLIFPTAGLYGNVIRMLVPLVATEEEIAEALEILDEAFAAVTGS
jgi:4-aminobutyrate aminotransferase/(S)-3-amino-2-methylpropionate transaminase